MDLPGLLHTAARRYCEERYAQWSALYSRMDREGGGYNRAAKQYSHRARDVFPRYLQIHAMQLAIERFVPEDFVSLDDARVKLQRACEAAEIPNEATRSDPLSSRAAEEERDLLLRYVAAMDEEALWRVRPMPFRRTLADAEKESLDARLVATFGRWYGGACDRKDPPEHLTFTLPLTPEHTPALRELLRPLAPRLFELRETEESFEQDLSAVNFWMTEAFWFTAELDFMVYVSHESTLTVAGGPLVALVRASQPSWLLRQGFPW